MPRMFARRHVVIALLLAVNAAYHLLLFGGQPDDNGLWILPGLLQSGLLGFWAGCGAGVWWMRTGRLVLLSVAAAELQYFVLLHAGDGPDIPAIIWIAFHLATFACTEIPCVLGRIFFGWQLVPWPLVGSRQHDQRQFSLRSLFVTAALAAVVAKLLISSQINWQLHIGWNDFGTILAFGSLALPLAGFAWMILGTQRRSRATGLAAGVLLTGLILVPIVSPWFGLSSKWDFLWIITVGCAYLASCLSLVVIRLAGYRLVGR